MSNSSDLARPMSRQAKFCQETTSPEVVQEIQQFRKSRFVDTLGWPLAADQFGERDDFDVPSTIHCGLFEDNVIVGCFRAVRTDAPYLAATKFPALATEVKYPRTSACWEISRLGVRNDGAGFSRSLYAYAAMFHFALSLNAFSLVAFCDLGHERLLRRLGIKTRRFGEPQLISEDDKGRPIQAVAGEIVIAHQDPKRLALLLAPLNTMEIEDGTALLGRSSLSA